jgi:hypothetical protein
MKLLSFERIFNEINNSQMNLNFQCSLILKKRKKMTEFNSAEELS